MTGGGPFEIQFHHEFPGDLKGVPANIQERILKVIEERLGRAPDRYGERLRKSLHGHWKLRVGDHRVVFEIVQRRVRVYAVMDLREVHTGIEKRTSKEWPEAPTAEEARKPKKRR